MTTTQMVPFQCPLSAVARSCPVVGSYPERDFTARSARWLETELERHGVPHDV
jgi:carboxymethylenebutenolidase